MKYEMGHRVSKELRERMNIKSMEVKMQPTFIVIFFLSSFVVVWLVVVVLVWSMLLMMLHVAVSMLVFLRQFASDSRLMPAPLSLRGIVHTATIVVLSRVSVVKMA